MHPANEPRAPRRDGFTLIELLVAMVLGVLVLGVSSNFAIATLRSSRATDIRDGLNRSARYVGMALQRDLQDGGVSFQSTSTFGAVAARGDTVMAISVPYLPNQAEIYRMVTPVPLTDPLPAGGTCGARCIDIVDPGVVPFQLAPGDPALLQVLNVRRLIVISSVATTSAGAKRITWAAGDSLFVYPLGLTNGLQLRRIGVAVQRLAVTSWFRKASDSTLVRSDGFFANGTMRQMTVGRGAETFTTRLLFTDGVERTVANGFDSDTTNDYDRISSVIARARLRNDRTDRNINGGAALSRNYEWRVSPRNLLFERNRAL